MVCNLSSTEAVILAGGFGTRLRETIPGIPKALVPIKGRPFLFWLLESLQEQGICRFHLALGFLAEQIEHAISESEFRDLTSCWTEEKPLGTGGALWSVQEKTELSDEIFVLNGDTILDISLEEVYENHEANNRDLTVVGALADAVDRYTPLSAGRNGELLGFASRASSGGGTQVMDAGLYLLKKELLKDRPSPEREVSLSGELIPGWMESGFRIGVFATPTRFLDIGTKSSYQNAQTSELFKDSFG